MMQKNDSQKKKIAIDLTSLYDHLSGIERYAMELTIRLISESSDCQYVLIFKNEIHERFAIYRECTNVKMIVLKGSNKLLFNQIILPIFLYKLKADAYVFLAFPEPILFFNKNIITAVHDMTAWDCPDTMKTPSRLYFSISNIHSLIFTKRIITISKFSASRICYYAKKICPFIYKYVRKKLRLIYCGVEPADTNSGTSNINILKKYGIYDDYFLSLSTIEPRKNLGLLIDAYDDLVKAGHKLPLLVLAGRNGWKNDEILRDISENTRKNIVFTGFVDDADLPVIYGGCKQFVFTSKYEGFGMPPVEALSYGAVVLSSDIPCMTEILGDNAVYFNNNDKEDLKEKLLLAVNESAPSTVNVDALLDKYSWEKGAKRLQLILTSLLRDMIL